MGRKRKYDVEAEDYKAYRRAYMERYRTPEKKMEMAARQRQKYRDDDEFRERKKRQVRESQRKKRLERGESQLN